MNSLGKKIGGVIFKADTAKRYSMEMLIEIPTDAAARGAASLAESHGMATAAAGQMSTAHSSNAHLFRPILLTQGGNIILTRGCESRGLGAIYFATASRPP